MNSLSSFVVNNQILYADQIRLAVEQTLPVEERASASLYANTLAEKINSYFSRNPLGEFRFSKKSQEGGSLPFTVWALKNAEGFFLHFIPNSFCEKQWKGTYKKVKESFELSISKEASPNEPIQPEPSVCYRIQEKKIARVRKGLKSHEKIIELFGNESYFPVLPREHPEFIGAKGSKKHEMVAPRYLGTLRDVYVKYPEFSGIFHRINHCLDVVKGLSLLRRENPPFIHNDIKEDNALVTSSSKSLLGDFDLTFQLPLGKICNFSRSRESCLHHSFLTRKNQVSLQTDLYSLAILIGEILLPGFSKVSREGFFKKSRIKEFQNGMLLAFSSFHTLKENLSVAIQRDIEKIFADHPFHASILSKELLSYAKSLIDSQHVSLVEQIALDLAIFDPIFQLVLEVLEKDENSEKEVLEGKTYLQALAGLHFPATYEIEAVLEECKKIILEGGEAVSTKAEVFAESQILYSDQIIDLVQKTLPRGSPDVHLHAQNFVENANAYLQSAPLEDFTFRFKKGNPWGVGHLMPFSGIIRREKGGIFLYFIPLSQNTYVENDTHQKIKKIWFSRISEQFPIDRGALVESSLCIRINRENFDNVNRWNWVQGKMYSNREAEKYLAFPSEHYSLYQGKKDFKAEFYDIESQGTLASDFSSLQIEQKIDVYLDMLTAIEILSQKNLVHKNIKSENVFLQYLENGQIRAKLSDFIFTKACSIPDFPFEYLIWPFASQQGYMSIETDIYSLMQTISRTLFGVLLKESASLESILDNFIKEAPENFRKQIKEIFQKTGSDGESFSRGLLALEINVEQDPIIEKLSVIFCVFTLIKKTLEADENVKQYILSKKTFSEELAKEGFRQHPFPNIAEIRTILEACKSQIEAVRDSIKKRPESNSP